MKTKKGAALRSVLTVLFLLSLGALVANVVWQQERERARLEGRPHRIRSQIQAFLRMVEKETTPSGQERGKESEYSAVAANKTGEWQTSNTVMTVLDAATEANLDLDWNVGPLAPVWWKMQPQDFPEELIKYKLRNAKARDSHPHHPDMKGLIFLESNVLDQTVHSAYVFPFHGIAIVSQQFEFMGTMPNLSKESPPGRPDPSDYNVRIVWNDSHTVGDWHGSDADIDRYFAALDKWKGQEAARDEIYRRENIKFRKALESLKLTSFYLFPEEAESSVVVRKLTAAFGQGPVSKRVGLPLPDGEVTWAIAEWQDQYSILRYVDVTRGYESLTHFLFVTSRTAEKEMKNLLNSHGKGGNSIQLSSVLEQLERKSWKVGYGWIRQRLIDGISLPDDMIENSLRQRSRLVYPYSVATNLYCLVFIFDDQEMLDSIHLVPSLNSNPRKQSPDGLTAFERRRLFAEYLEAAKHKFPDKALGLLRKAAALYPNDPDLTARKVPRFTIYKDMPGSEEYRVDRVVVDWKYSMEWVLSPSKRLRIRPRFRSWYEAREWTNNLASFRGGGWEMPSISQLADVGTIKGVPFAFAEPRSDRWTWIWTGDETDNGLNAYVASVRPAEVGRTAYAMDIKHEVNFYAAVRPLRRELLPTKFVWYESDPNLPLK